MNHVPNYTWHHVFANFQRQLNFDVWWEDDEQCDISSTLDLLAICITCRRFRAMAQPLLYRTIFLSGQPNDQVTKSLFARTLSLNPALGLDIRAVVLNTSLPLVEDFREACIPRLRREDLPLSLVQQLNKSVFSRRNYECNAFTSFILVFMPHIQVVDVAHHHLDSLLPWMLSGSPSSEDDLRMNPRSDSHQSTGDDEDEHDDDDQVMSGMSGSYTEEQNRIERPASYFDYSLPFLTEVRFRTDTSDETTGVWEIEPILLHPTLKNLKTVGIDWSTGGIERFKWPSRTSSLQQLQLRECIIDSDGLESVFIRCPMLQSLSMHMSFDRKESDETDYHGGAQIINLDKFGCILRDQGHNLHKLDIDTSLFGRYHILEGHLGSLQELSMLRHLRVSLEDLLDKKAMPADAWELMPVMYLGNSLPHSLEKLYLHYGGRRSYWGSDGKPPGALDEELYYSMIQNRLPRLREIRIERPDQAGQWNQFMEGWVCNIVYWRTLDPSTLRVHRDILILSRE